MCIVFTVYEYYICITHLAFGDFMPNRQDHFILSSHSKHVDGTEEEVLHREAPHHLQAQRGFLTSSPNGVRTCSDTSAEDQLVRNQ